MNVGSTFSGVGGIDLGLERAGMRVVWNAEQDEWCRGVLRHHWPDAEQYADVRDVAQGAKGARPGRLRTPGANNNGSDPCGCERGSPSGRVDLLCGGFPCQDLSVAGRRAGLAGARSGLFWEFHRILAALQPRWLLLENVPGLLSSNDGRDFGVLLGSLVDLGYGVAWRVLDSRFYGVPQRRRRVFIVGRAGGDHAGALRALCESCEGSPTASECSWQDATTRPRGRIAKSLNAGSRYDLDTEDFIVSGCASELDIAASLITNAQGGLRTTDIDGATWVASEPSVRRLTPRECERLQGFPDDWTLIPGLKCPDSRRYAAMGNAVTVNVSEFIGRRILAVEASS